MVQNTPETTTRQQGGEQVSVHQQQQHQEVSTTKKAVPLLRGTTSQTRLFSVTKGAAGPLGATIYTPPDSPHEPARRGSADAPSEASADSWADAADAAATAGLIISSFGSATSNHNIVVNNQDETVSAVRLAMGGFINRIQKELGFPLEEATGDTKASEVVAYNLAAQTSFRLGGAGTWEILKGLILQAVVFKTAVAAAEASGNDLGATLAVELAAYLFIENAKVLVAGNLGSLTTTESGDTELTLRLGSTSSKPSDSEAFNVMALIRTLAGTVPDESARDAVLKSAHLLAQAIPGLDSAGSVSQSAMMTICRPRGGDGSSSSYLKRLEISLDRMQEWEIIPGKLMLSDCLPRIVFSRQGPSEQFQALIDVDGHVSITKSSVVKIQARLTVGANGDIPILELATSRILGTGTGVKPSQVLSFLSGNQITQSSLSKTLVTIPGLPITPDNQANNSEVSVVFTLRDSKWQLHQARTAIYPSSQTSPTWKPLSSGTAVQDLYYILAVYRPEVNLADLKKDPLLWSLPVELDQVGQTSEDGLVYQALVPGSIRLPNATLPVLVDHDSKTYITRLRILLPDGQHEVSLLDAVSQCTNVGITKLLGDIDAPKSAPVSFRDSKLLNQGFNRQITISFTNGTTLSRVNFSAQLPGKETTWSLIKGLTLGDIGVYFDFLPSTKTLSSFIFGHFSLTNGTGPLYAFIPGISRGSRSPDFKVFFSQSINPFAGLSGSMINPMLLLDEFGITPATDGWENNMPSILPHGLGFGPLAVLKNPNASINLRFRQAHRKPVFLSAQTFVRVTGGTTWDALPGLALQDLVAYVVTTIDNKGKPITNFEIRGKPIKDLSGTSSSGPVSFIKVVYTQTGDSQITTVSPDGDEKPAGLSLSPQSLLSLTSFDPAKLDNMLLDLIPASFPIQPWQVIQSKPERPQDVVLDTSKDPNTGDLNISKLQFSAQSDEPHDLVPGGMVQIIRSVLKVVVNNPQSGKGPAKPQQQQVSTTATADLNFGGLHIPDAVVTFEKPSSNKPARQIFDVRVPLVQLQSIIQTLTGGQDWTALTPPGLPALDDDDDLQVQLIFGADRSIQSLIVSYPPDTGINFAPFAIHGLAVTFTWEAPGTAPTVVLDGQAFCGMTPLKEISLSYDQTKPSSSVSFVVDPQPGKLLNITDLQNAGLPAPQFEAPQGISFQDAKLSVIKGVYGARPDGSIGILDFESVAHVDQTVTVLEFESKKIELRGLELRWTYHFDSVNPVSKVVIFANLPLGSKSEIPLQLGNAPDGQEVWTGSLSPGTCRVDFKEPFALFLPNGSYSLPSDDLALPSDGIPLSSVTVTLIRNQSIELTGQSNISWDIPLDKRRGHICLDHVGVYLKADKTAPIAASITGVLSLGDHFKSIEGQRAGFDLSTVTVSAVGSSILRANIVSTDDKPDLDKLTRDLRLKPFRELVDGGITSSFTLDASKQTPLLLHVDFKKGSGRPLLLAGKLSGARDIFLLSRSSEYVVFAPSSAALTSQTAIDLRKAFGAGHPLDTVIVSSQVTVCDLVDNVSIVKDLLNTSGNLNTSSWGTALPGSTSITQGAWFFTDIKLTSGSQGQLTQALAHISKPGYAPHLTVYGALGGSSKQHRVIVRNLTILDSALTVDLASGSFSSTLLDLQGRLRIRGLDIGKQDVVLNVSISVSNTGAQFGLVKKDFKLPTIKNPLGGIPDGSFAVRSLTGTIEYTEGTPRTNSIILYGDAVYGQGPAQPAKVIFVHGLPQVVSIDVKDGAFHDLLSFVVGPKQASDWLAKSPRDINVSSGTIYFAKQNTPNPDHSTEQSVHFFHKGYRLTAYVSVAGTVFNTRVDFVNDGKDFVLNGTAIHPLDGGFIKLLKPTIALNSKDAELFLTSSKVSFLNDDALAPIRLVFDATDSVFKGSLHRPGNEKEPEAFVTVILRPDGTFTLDDWIIPALDVPDEDIIKQIPIDQAIAQVTGLPDLSFSRPVVPRFWFKIRNGSTSTASKDGNFHGSLIWNCSLTIPGSDHVVHLTLPEKPISFNLLHLTTTHHVTQTLVTTVQHHITTIGQAIVDRPDDFGKILDIQNPNKLGSLDTIKALIALGMIRSNVLQKHIDDHERKEQRAFKKLTDQAGGNLDAAHDTLDKLDQGPDRDGLFDGAKPTSVVFIDVLQAYFASLGPINSLAQDTSKMPAGVDVDKLQAQRKAVRDKVERVLRFRGLPKFRIVEGRFVLDWNEVLPAPLVDSGDVLKTLVWEVAYFLEGAKEPQVLTVDGKDTRWSASPDSLGVKPGYALKISVRAKFEYEGETFVGSWSEPVAQVFTATLEAPQGLTMVSTTEQSDTVSVHFPSSVQAGTYEIVIAPVGHETSSIPPILQTKVDIKGEQTIKLLDVWTFPEDALQHGILQILVRRLTTDETKFHDSVWIPVPGSQFTAQTFEGAGHIVPSMTARRFGQAVLIEWDQPKSSTISSGSIDLVVFGQDHQKKPLRLMPSSADTATRRVVKFSDLPIRSSDGSIDLAIRIVPGQVTARTFYLPARTSIKVQPESVLSITDDSYFDMGTQSTVLFVSTESEHEQVPGEVIVGFLTADGTRALPDLRRTVEQIEQTCGRIVVHLQLRDIKNLPAWIRVTSVVPANSSASEKDEVLIGSPSEPWEFPDLSSSGASFTLPPFHVSTGTSDGSIKLSWPRTAGAPSRNYFFTLLNGKTSSSPFTPDTDADSITFPADAVKSVLGNDNHVIISVVTNTVTQGSTCVRSAPFYLRLTIPSQQSTQATTTPSGAKATSQTTTSDGTCGPCQTWRILPQSNLVALDGQTTEFFTSIHDPEVSQTQIRCILPANIDGGHAVKSYPITAAAEPPLLDGSSAIAVTQSSNGATRLFYIGERGRIYGASRRPTDGNALVWRTITATAADAGYPFKEGTASTLGGGAISALSGAKGTELFWAAPDGSICRAEWSTGSEAKIEKITPEGSIVAEAALRQKKGSVTKDSRPALAATKVGGNIVLFSVVWDGSVVSFVGPKFTPVPISTRGSGQTAKSSLTSGIATAVSDDKVYIFWVNTQGTVQGASASISALDDWTIFDVSAPKSAHPHSKITAISGPAAEGLMVLWSGADRRVVAARPILVDGAEAGGVASWYSFEFGGDQMARVGEEGPFQVAVAGGKTGKRALAWGDEEQRVGELEFGFDGEWVAY